MHKKYDNPSERVRKTSGDLDNIKKALVTTTDTVVKEVNTDIVYKKNKHYVVKETITSTISSKKKIDTVYKTDKSQASNKTVDTPRSNKTDKFK